MKENIYKGFLAAVMLMFALYILTKIKIFGAIGGLLIILTAFIRFFTDWKNGKFKKKKKKTVQMEQRNVK